MLFPSTINNKLTSLPRLKRRISAKRTSQILLYFIVFALLIEFVDGKASKAGIRTKLHQKSRKVHHDMGKQFGSFGNIPNAGYVAGNLNQLGDEDEMEIVDENNEVGKGEVEGAEDEYEEYLAEDDPSGGEEISNEIQHPPLHPSEPRFVILLG